MSGYFTWCLRNRQRGSRPFSEMKLYTALSKPVPPIPSEYISSTRELLPLVLRSPHESVGMLCHTILRRRDTHIAASQIASMICKNNRRHGLGQSFKYTLMTPLLYVRIQREKQTRTSFSSCGYTFYFCPSPQVESEIWKRNLLIFYTHFLLLWIHK